MKILRKILAVLVGMFVGGMAIGAVQAIGHRLYPFPPGADPNNPDDLARYVETAPFMAIFFVIISYAAGALTSGFLSTLIAPDRKKIYAVVAGVLFLITSIYMMSTLPTPLWFWICGILVWLLVLVGWKLAVLLKKN